MTDGRVEKVDLHSMAMQEIPTISEEGCNPNKPTAGVTNGRLFYRRSTAGAPLRSSDSRLSHRISSSSAGAPLRSSLKGSSSSLRSSLKSAFSLDSDGIEGSVHPTESRMQHNVSFSSLEIRSYNVTLGDAPTSNGPPISLSWEYDPSATEEYHVDYYENYRADQAPVG